MNQRKIIITRQELYEKVWSTPMIKLAEEFGLSDVGLAKVCKRHNIPRPDRGYWAKLEHGKKVKKKALPETKDGVSEEVVISTMELASECTDQEQLSDAELLMRIIKSEGIVPVDLTLSNPHPLIERAHKSLMNARKNSSGILCPSAKKCLSIRVSQQSLKRALAITDSVIKSIEKHGMTVSLPQEKGKKTILLVLGEKIGFSIHEDLDAIEKELTPRQKKEKERYSWMYNRPEYDYKPNGKLGLHISVDEYVQRIRQQWADGIKQRVEDCIGSFMIGLVKAAVAVRTSRLEIEERDRKWAEQERLREERRKRELEERQRIDNLECQVTNWKKGVEIKEYLDAAKKFTEQERGGWDEGSDFGQWLKWAYGYAERLSPLKINQEQGD